MRVSSLCYRKVDGNLNVDWSVDFFKAGMSIRKRVSDSSFLMKLLSDIVVGSLAIHRCNQVLTWGSKSSKSRWGRSDGYFSWRDKADWAEICVKFTVKTVYRIPGKFRGVSLIDRIDHKIGFL